MPINFRQGLNPAQQQSITNLVQSGRRFNETDARNFAFATGGGDFNRFVGLTGQDAIGSTQPQTNSTPRPTLANQTAPATQTSPLLASPNRSQTQTTPVVSDRKAAQNRIIGLLSPTQREQDVQKKIDALLSSSELGISNLEGQGRAIPLPLIRGQQSKLAEQATMQLSPLQREQARLTGTRQAELGAAERMLQFLPEEQQPITLSPGESIFDPTTGQVVFTAPERPSDNKPVTQQVGNTLLQYNPDTGTWDNVFTGTATGPSSFQEWSLAGGEQGTGMTYAEYLKDSDIGSAPTSYKEWELAGGINTGMTYGDWLLERNEKPPTQGQYAAAQFASRIQSANKIIDDLEESFTGKLQLGKILPESLKTEDRKLLEQAQRNFINAVLRRESGAAIAPSEFESAAKQYFPQPSDTEAVLKQKRENREIVEQSMINEAGRAFQESTLDIGGAEQLQLNSQIQEARNNNFSDEEIINYLQQNNQNLQTQIQQALDNNYSPSEILDYLSQQAFNQVGSDTNNSFKQITPNDVDKVMESIGKYESGNNYYIRGPLVQSGQYAGERAMGKYQIMPGNLPSWSRAALGRVVSEQEFMSNPNIQDKIAKHKFKQLIDKYGTLEDVASVWFSGRPVSQAGQVSDVLGTTVPQYITRITSIYNK